MWTICCFSLSLEKARILQGDSNWPKREGRGGKENVRFFVRLLHKIVGLCKRVFFSHCSVFHLQRGYVPKPALRIKRSNVRLYTLASKFFTARDNTALQKHREPQRHLLHIDRVQRKIRDLSRKLRVRVNYSIFWNNNLAQTQPICEYLQIRRLLRVHSDERHRDRKLQLHTERGVPLRPRRPQLKLVHRPKVQSG